MIVVDTDVIASFWIRVRRTEVAYAARQRDPDWVAPLLWRSEFRSVLRKYMANRHLTYQEAATVAHSAERSMRGKEFVVESADVLKLVEKTGHSSYDCEYVALAEALDIKLVTGDRKLANRFRETCIPLEAFVP